jgi:hypothetical protein
MELLITSFLFSHYTQCQKDPGIKQGSSLYQEDLIAKLGIVSTALRPAQAHESKRKSLVQIEVRSFWSFYATHTESLN